MKNPNVGRSSKHVRTVIFALIDDASDIAFLNAAKSIFDKMKDLGIGVYTNWMMPGYSLRMFAEMRGYATEELEQLDRKSQEVEEKMERREAKFLEKYGTDRSKWSYEIWEEYEYSDNVSQ